jgi:hypothetical protein
MSASKSVVVNLQQLSLEECNSNGSPTTTSLHYFNECCLPAISRLSRRRLPAVKFGGVQTNGSPTTLHYFNECSPAIDMRVVGMSASKSVVVILQQLSLEECDSNGSPTTTSLHYFNECCLPANDTSRRHSISLRFCISWQNLGFGKFTPFRIM